MSADFPQKVLITGGREVGGLCSFAEGLHEGFVELGIPAEIIRPFELLFRWRDLRDRRVLKILSTTALFAAPFARRAICVAHGFPRPDAQGWLKILAILASFKLANLSSACQLTAVSEYAAAHLRAIYRLRVDAVIHNPLQSVFCEPWHSSEPRNYLTYVGRLVPVKNLHRLLPAMLQLLERDPELRICIIGDGPQRRELEALVQNKSRVEFAGTLNAFDVRVYLRKTSVFVSGCETEALGLAYVEALSQGCAVAMPACGGGLEIAPALIGTQIHLLPLSFHSEEIFDVLWRAAKSTSTPLLFDAYAPAATAAEYLKCDSHCLSKAPAVWQGAQTRETGSDAH
jgi:glycosyltransferase involved in cell wall biosynthesis